MKFIGFFEFKPEDTDKVLEKFKEMSAERAKGNPNFAKAIVGPFAFSGESKGFGVYETDDMNAITNTGIFYMPILTLKFIPILLYGNGASLASPFLYRLLS